MYTHYLITRFNIKIAGAGPERLDSAEVDQAWFQERLKLFRSHCAPSVLEQTNTNFTWLIYFDPSTSLAELDYLRDHSVAVELIYTEDFDSMVQDMISRIRSAPTTYVITTRLDNDDVVSSGFIEAIQRSCVSADKVTINANAGYVYDAETHLLTRWNKRYKNQFLSLVEDKRSTQLLSIYGFPHWRPPADARMINIDGTPLWMYWRHGHNYSQQERAGIPVFVKTNLKMFPATIQSIPISGWKTFQYLMEWIPKVVRRRIKNALNLNKK